MKKAFVSLCMMLCTATANAGGVDLALSTNTAHISMLLNPHAFYQGGGSEAAFGGFISEEGDKLLHTTLMKTRSPTVTYDNPPNARISALATP